MKPFVLTRKAVSDLHAIARYTEQRWGSEQRNLYLRQLDDAFHLLARSPLAGRACDDIRSGYRKLPQGSHVIFYRSGDNLVEIVRILHRSMDVDSILSGE